MFTKKIVTAASAVLAFSVIAGVVLWGGDNHPPSYEVSTPRFMVLGTFAQIQLRCRTPRAADQALERAKAALEEIDRLMSTYRDDSEISAINRAEPCQPVAVSPKTYHVIAFALNMSRLTDGAFDITVGPLLELWRTAARQDRLPTPDELQAAIKPVGYQYIQLHDNPLQVSLVRPDMRLNVDAVAKGYAVDQVLDAVHIDGVEAALVDIGGEIACFGQNKSDQKWRIGVQNPFAENTDDQLSQEPGWIIELKDAAVATSGNYRRFFIIQDKRYNHILDPRIGKSVDALAGVTIIAPTAMQADALATAVSVLGREKGLAIIESLKETEAFLVAGSPDSHHIFRSSGFHLYQVE